MLNKCMEKSTDEFIVKGLNLLVDSEFKFFIKRKPGQDKSAESLESRYEMAELL